MMVVRYARYSVCGVVLLVLGAVGSSAACADPQFDGGRAAGLDASSPAQDAEPAMERISGR